MAEEEKPEAEEVRVRRTEIMVPVAEGEPSAMIYVTYTVKDLPPGLITISKAEWTAEKEADLIREDIKKRRAAKPTVVRI